MAIAEEFGHAGGLETGATPFVSSGSCHHEGGPYNPNHEHHGFALIDTKDGGFYYGGIFAFFHGENRYAGLTVEEARKRVPKIFDDNHRLEVYADYAAVDMNPKPVDPRGIVRYWLRQNGDKILLFGQWGLYHRVYCRFQRH
jgi:hypothetical protein